jgi:hypothetical protein
MKNPEILKKFQKPQERIECPHCGKMGGKSLIKRYHFDNCTKSTTAVAQNCNFINKHITKEFTHDSPNTSRSCR